MNNILQADRLGITASGLCAIHCAALPFVMGILPLWGMTFLAHPALEAGMILLSLLLALGSILHSYRYHHRRPLPLLLVGAGFAAIASGHLLETSLPESVLVPAGGISIALAHFFNLRFNRQCKAKLAVPQSTKRTRYIL
ncbi:MerC domain-containing protein [Pedobacter yulinensis]|uniref:MerC domain-containing protein n=1 Tax=Pedobacter yulinensis TaxID=2126353 RepID=A0A2T3HLL0_9SPHI|nr:MerC domain-containing protein [Pedobacter yulinensis]PST83348.1 MerC domain-containing protein [Pedobacter yulinensis]